jgi:di/tricarboxylate transporter
MTFDIALVLAILVGAVILFVTEKLRVDVVAMMVLVTLALTGLITAEDAVSSFRNPAVITVGAVFVLSAGLSRTGVAGILGRQVLRLAGDSELLLVILIMAVAAFMSAFMNNVGVAALLLPVIMDIARRTGRPPSKLLIPLAFSSLLGGLTTLIGTPPNILVSASLEEHGMQPFDLFDFTPVGLTIVLAGIAYMAFIGRRLLPVRDFVRETSPPGGEVDLSQAYQLGDQLFVVRLPGDSVLDGKTLAESRLGVSLGLNVVGIMRQGEMRLAPDPRTRLRSGDRLLVGGAATRLDELRGHRYLQFETDSLAIERLVSTEIEVVEVEVQPNCRMIGKNLRELDFRNEYGCIVLAIYRDGLPRRTGLEIVALAAGDVLLVQGTHESLDRLRRDECLVVSSASETEVYELEKRLMLLQVPENSSLAGKTLGESHLGDKYNLGIMGIVRDGATELMPGPDKRIAAGDTLLVKGKKEDLLTVEGLHELQVESEEVPGLEDLESEDIGLAEVVLSPRTTLVGKTLVELHFREKYGLNVIAISREGEVFRENLRDVALRFGDALLLYGAREKLKVLGSEPDFLVLTEEAQEPVRTKKAPLAAATMLAVVLSVLLGFLPIYIAALTGAVVMVLSGSLTMDEAYRNVEWRAVFLIAGMLPMGVALQKTGAAELMTEQVVNLVGGMGPLAVVAAFYIVTAIGAQVMPTAAVAILMAPIALNTANNLGLSPYALMMTVAMSASASFMSPVAHPANVLIMGPGGYRFVDYIKVGLPLTLVCLAVVLLVLPIFWPLVP